ncbi:hypothetical protein T07_12487 [Trichinella nelsoni]|uniref:Uncharacterized protein n=1 Tax=Trichinella nelsoni TaxID=6336 RepID=A0A0V0SH14_9BILA|nr:hypothetical protein T07_5345 [Trichinella nelsoni]KRX22540.1 hypothetical protein T07_7657 [Trichinella nelsoni]KRX25573.1 hypothetical protein T07_12487 [Trichinella nelsoni]
MSSSRETSALANTLRSAVLTDLTNTLPIAAAPRGSFTRKSPFDFLFSHGSCNLLLFISSEKILDIFVHQFECSKIISLYYRWFPPSRNESTKCCQKALGSHIRRGFQVYRSCSHARE